MRDPPQQLPRVWDFGQRPQWEEQTPQPELMETGENNGIVSCMWFALRVETTCIPQQGHAGFCYPSDSFHQLHLLQ